MTENPVKIIAEDTNITKKTIRVLAVDDEEYNLEILVKHLEKGGYSVAQAKDGGEAWEYLQKHPLDVQVVLLDKMMPKMNGMEVLRRMKEHPQLKNITVIMQTASVGTKEVVEGIKAGAYYYLTKPYPAEVLMSIVDAAARDYVQNNELKNEVDKNDRVMAITKYSEFEYRTLGEARALAAHIGSFFPDSSRIVVSLASLMINAVEHGNLGIGYDKKLELLTEGKSDWEEEISKRVASPENAGKCVRVSMKREGNKTMVHIKDQGKGFNWKPYLDFDPSRITDPNGRGIAMAHIMSPGCIAYVGNGSEVVYTIDPEKIAKDKEMGEEAHSDSFKVVERKQ